MFPSDFGKLTFSEASKWVIAKHVNLMDNKFGLKKILQNLGSKVNWPDSNIVGKQIRHKI